MQNMVSYGQIHLTIFLTTHAYIIAREKYCEQNICAWNWRAEGWHQLAI
jgi:hypothetical protein